MAEFEELRISVRLPERTGEQFDKFAKAMREHAYSQEAYKLKESLSGVSETLKKITEVVSGAPEGLLSLATRAGATGVALGVVAKATLDAIKMLHEAAREAVKLDQAAKLMGMSTAQLRETLETLGRAQIGPDVGLRNLQRMTERWTELQKLGSQGMMKELLHGIPPGSAIANELIGFAERYRSETDHTERLNMIIEYSRELKERVLEDMRRGDPHATKEEAQEAARRMLRWAGLDEQFQFVEKVLKTTKEQDAEEARRNQITKDFLEQTTIISQQWDRLIRSIDTETMNQILFIVRGIAEAMKLLADLTEQFKTTLSDILLLGVDPGAAIGHWLNRNVTAPLVRKVRPLRPTVPGGMVPPVAPHLFGSLDSAELDKAMEENTEELKRLNDFLQSQIILAQQGGGGLGLLSTQMGGVAAGYGAGSGVASAPNGSSVGPGPTSEPPTPSQGPGPASPGPAAPNAPAPAGPAPAAPAAPPAAPAAAPAAPAAAPAAPAARTGPWAPGGELDQRFKDAFGGGGEPPQYNPDVQPLIPGAIAPVPQDFQRGPAVVWPKHMVGGGSAEPPQGGTPVRGSGIPYDKYSNLNDMRFAKGYSRSDWAEIVKAMPYAQAIKDRMMRDRPHEDEGLKDFLNRSGVTDAEIYGVSGRDLDRTERGGVEADVEVNVKAPRGTTVKSDGDGMFEGNVETNRTVTDD